MFLVKRPLHGITYLVFTGGDPRKEGYKGEVEEKVSLDYDQDAVHTWADGEPRPEACVGQSPENPKHYKVFKYASDLKAAGYRPIPGTPVEFGFWSEYLRLTKDWDLLSEEDWYQDLDNLDEAARRRRNGNVPDGPSGTSRDDVAAWVAKRHFVVDSSIREVWYLPHGAPPDEIRLLEVNDRLAANETKAEAIDFGLDVEGAPFHLWVADITSDLLERLKQDPARLPTGWSLSENKVWRRGA